MDTWLTPDATWTLAGCRFLIFILLLFFIFTVLHMIISFVFSLLWRITFSSLSSLSHPMTSSPFSFSSRQHLFSLSHTPYDVFQQHPSQPVHHFEADCFEPFAPPFVFSF
jgi:hypothetical protein